jgi:hypothetical protein
MPLSSQLQQHWQTVVDRLPADFPVSTLSEQAVGHGVQRFRRTESDRSRSGWQKQSAPRGAGVAHYAMAAGRLAEVMMKPR